MVSSMTGHRHSLASASSGSADPTANAAVQETHFTTTDPSTATTTGPAALTSSTNDSTCSRPPSRHAKKLSYGSISNGFPTSPPTFSPPISGHHQAQPSAPAPPAADLKGSTRVLAPDLLRGLLMVLQSIDHSAVQMATWRHGVTKVTEGDATPVDQWNPGRAWWARMLTHLCAPGFMFLLGMGTVYFTRSRTKLGWSTSKLLRHYVVRMLALVFVNQVLMLVLIPGQTQLWLLNIVLVALAVNYLISGVLCLVFRYTEPRLAGLLSTMLNDSTTAAAVQEDSEAHAPLLSSSTSSSSSNAGAGKATTLSWHMHNLFLLVLASLSIYGNVYLSPHGGQCSSVSSAVVSLHREDVLYHPLRLSASAGPQLPPPSPPNGHSAFFSFWFYPYVSAHVVSPFPPLAWWSFVLFGVLYARIVTARRWKAETIVWGNFGTAVALAILFVLTRLLHFGNLSEGCLHMPEHVAHPGRNQYLASFRSFFYVVKYPPSVSFFALTLSLNFFLLALFGAVPWRWAIRLPGLMNYGSSALFFYLMHFIVYRLLSIPALRFFSHRLPDDDASTGEPAYGVGDGLAYWTFWVVGLVILSPLCRAYGRFKAGRRVDSIWRFF